MYNAVKQAAAGSEIGAVLEFPIHKADANDLRKLTVSDLVDLDYDRLVAADVSAALLGEDYGPLGRTMGIRFIVNFEAPRLGA